MNADFQQEFLNSVKIYNFLEVDAPDVLIRDAFWHDANDNPIDCNIYHPKYGTIEVNNKYGKFDVRLGFLTTSKEHVISSCTYSYQSYETHETIYCQFKPLPLLCIDEMGGLTNKDGVTIKKVDYLRTHQTRKAIDANDFSEIYKREFLENKLIDTVSNHATLKSQLEKEVIKLISYHENNREYGRTLDLQIIAKANEFLNWLPSYVMPPIVIDGVLFINELVSKIHKTYNDIIFFSISEKQLFDALNDPMQYGKFIKLKPDNKGQLTGLIRYLENKCGSKKWRIEMLNSIPEIDANYYSKQSSNKLGLIKID